MISFLKAAAVTDTDTEAVTNQINRDDRYTWTTSTVFLRAAFVFPISLLIVEYFEPLITPQEVEESKYLSQLYQFHGDLRVI